MVRIYETQRKGASANFHSDHRATIARIYYAIQPPTLLESYDTADLKLAGLFEKGSRQGFQRDHIRRGSYQANEKYLQGPAAMDVPDPLSFVRRWISGTKWLFCFQYISENKRGRTFSSRIPCPLRKMGSDLCCFNKSRAHSVTCDPHSTLSYIIFVEV